VETPFLRSTSLQRRRRAVRGEGVVQGFVAEAQTFTSTGTQKWFCHKVENWKTAADRRNIVSDCVGECCKIQQTRTTRASFFFFCSVFFHLFIIYLLLLLLLLLLFIVVFVSILFICSYLLDLSEYRNCRWNSFRKVVDWWRTGLFLQSANIICCSNYFTR
jgi:Flp pilus assembly protein TadB